MKNLLFLIVALCFATTTLAQKGKLSSAKSSLESGDFAAAYKAIQAASSHDKTKGLPEVWAIKAQILSGIKMDPMVSEIIGITVTDEELYGALNQAKELDKDGKFQDVISESAQVIINNVHNSGVTAFSTDKDYAAAVDLFTQKIELQELYTPEAAIDTVSYLIIGASHYELGNNLDAVKNYEVLMDLGYDDQAVFNTVINHYRETENDQEYLDALKKAQKQFPEVNNYMLLEIDHLIAIGEVDSALEDMLAAHEADPSNTTLMSSIATIYKGKVNISEERKWLSKIIETDPSNRIAAFNLGVSYFNEAVKNNDIMNFEPSTTTTAYIEAKKQRDLLTAKAFPYFENAYNTTPEDPGVLRALIQYHRMMQNKDLKAKYEAELAAVE